MPRVRRREKNIFIGFGFVTGDYLAQENAKTPEALKWEGRIDFLCVRSTLSAGDLIGSNLVILDVGERAAAFPDRAR
jgi:hypothetical protein